MKKRLFPTFPDFSRLFETKLQMSIYLVFSLYNVNYSSKRKRNLIHWFSLVLLEEERRFEEEKKKKKKREKGEAPWR